MINMFYPVRMPWIIQQLNPTYIWTMDAAEKVLYLTFDDGPHPSITPFVLDQLKEYEAKATFFCIGDNVQKFPDTYKRILMDGHRVGNHTEHHLNGWKSADEDYVKDVYAAAEKIDSYLFRPPYGRITRFQSSLLMDKKFRIIMWDVLSGDFDRSITGDVCALRVIRKGRQGSVVVFHDSEKAFPRLQAALPKVLEHFSKEGYVFRAIP